MFNIFVSIFILIGITSTTITPELNVSTGINKTVIYLEEVRNEHKVPGIVAGISINGTQVWADGFGQTDIENNVKTQVNSVWRLASISKSLTSALIGTLIDKRLVNLNESVHKYLSPNVFPTKHWNNTNVTITVGQVMSHTAGLHVMQSYKELFNNFTFENITQTIAQFKDEPLISAPGSQYNYSNYGYQVLGAIIESVLNQTFESAINKMFKDMGMNSTLCERHEYIIPHRARYYMIRDADSPPNPYGNGKILNTLLSDDLVSEKRHWPSGGLISTVPDLLIFGNHMINWFNGINDSKSVHINSSTIQRLWNAVIKLDEWTSNTTHSYAHGWVVSTLNPPIDCQKCKSSPIRRYFWHSGGLNGVRTLLLLFPDQEIVFVFFANCPLNITNNEEYLRIGLNVVKNFTE